MFGRIGDAGGSERDARRRGENRGRGVIAVGVNRAAIVRARRAGETPANGGIGFAAAGDAGLKGLQRTELDGSGKRGECDPDIAGDGDARCGGFGGIGVAGGGDLNFSADREIGGSGEEPVGSDGADLRRATGNAVYAPGDRSVGGIANRRGKRERITEENGAGIGSDGYGDLRWRRRRCAATTTAACDLGECENEQQNGMGDIATSLKAPNRGALL